jgi:hypothetical protein
MSEDEDLPVRIGAFLILVGLVLLAAFIITDVGGKPDFDFLFLSMLTIGGGWLFRRRKPPPPTSGRFGIIQKIQANAKKRKEDKQKAKQKK